MRNAKKKSLEESNGDSDGDLILTRETHNSHSRKSEYLPFGAVSGGLSWKDIPFFGDQGLKIDWSLIRQ